MPSGYSTFMPARIRAHNNIVIFSSLFRMAKTLARRRALLSSSFHYSGRGR
jgi:hypothetical protein